MNFKRSKKRTRGSALRSWRKVLVSTLAGLIVFSMTYALILPAITLDDNAAESEPGITVEHREEKAEPKPEPKVEAKAEPKAEPAPAAEAPKAEPEPAAEAPKAEAAPAAEPEKAEPAKEEAPVESAPAEAAPAPETPAEPKAEEAPAPEPTADEATQPEEVAEATPAETEPAEAVDVPADEELADAEEPAAALNVTLANVPLYGVAGRSMAVSVNIAGGVAPYTVNCDGSTAKVEAESQVSLRVTPASYGTYNLSVKVTDAEGQTASVSAQIPVSSTETETRASWEKDLKKVKLTGNWMEDVIAIAETQLGYRESETNFIIREDGTKQGYTRYGDWAGLPYEEWCAMFVSFCLDYAEVPKTDFIQSSGVNRWAKGLKDLYEDDEDKYEPQPGDLIFFHHDREGSSKDKNYPNHVGIVIRVTDKKIYTIEGNSGRAVKTNEYNRKDAHDMASIVGYGLLTKAYAEAHPEPEETPEPTPVIMEAPVDELLPEEGELVEEPVEETEAADEADDTEIAEETDEIDETEIADELETPVELAASVSASALECRAGDEVTFTIAYEGGVEPVSCEIIVLQGEEELYASEQFAEAEAVEAVEAEDEQAESEEGAEQPEASVVNTKAVTVQALDLEETSLITLTAVFTDAEGAVVEATADVICVVEEYEAFDRSYSGDDYTILVHVGADAEIPVDAELRVAEILPGTAEYEEYNAQAGAEMDDFTEIKFARFFDIAFVVDGEEVEPAAPVGVEISFAAEGDDMSVLHFAEEGAQVLENETTSDEEGVNTITFQTDGFSVFGFVGTETLTTKYITADGETYTITVTYGPEAEIPAGAFLDVREVPEGSAEYESYIQQTREAFAAEHADDESEEISASELPDDLQDVLLNGEEEEERDEISFARFFDITIYTDEGKVEPKAPVEVNIRYDDAIQLEEDEQIKAIHFASTGTELISVDVVENAEGITEVTFMQDSFSVSGTIVQYLASGWPTNDSGYVMIVRPYNSSNYYAVRNDGQITSVVYNTSTGKVTFSDLTSTEQLADYLWTVASAGAGYNNQRRLSSGGDYLDLNDSDGISSTNRRLSRTTGGNIYSQSGGYSSTNYYMRVNENSLIIEGQGSNNSDNRAVVMFANDFEVDEVPEPSEDPEEVDLGAPTAGKTLTPNNDGTYDLALSVTGKSQAKNEHTKADILVILDTSGSMTSSRMSTAKSALSSLAETLYANNTEEHPDTIRMKLMTFSSVTQLRTNAGAYYNEFAWTEGRNGATAFIAQLGQLADVGQGGTNWEDALQDAGSVSMRTDAAKYVIFVSDGNPTFRNTKGQNNWNDNNSYYQNAYGHTIYGTGSDTTTGPNGSTNATSIQRNYEMARDDAKALRDAGMEFYTIGVFGNVDRMNNLTAYAYSGSDSGSYPAGHYQSAENETALNQAFANIINDIQKNFTYTGVEIDDGITALTATALVSGTVDNFTYKITDEDGNDITETEMPKIGTEASYDGNQVTWAIGEGTSYKLLDGATYTVSFTVWPNQRAYDIIAELANGTITYDSLTEEEKASIDRATLTLKTNSEASVTYRQIVTVNGEDSEPSDPKTIGIDNPPGVPLAGTDLKIAKRWNDDLDHSQLLDLLTEYLNDDGTDTTYSVRLDVTADKTTPVATADYPDGFIYKPDVTISGGKVTEATWPTIDIAIAPGVMVSEAKAKEHGFDKHNPPYPTITMNVGGYSGTYYIIESGHRYEVTEANTDYHFEMVSDVDHPMLIDGVLKNLILNDAGTEVIGITPSTGNLTELTATNNLKGGINIVKKVEDADGNEITPKDAVFTVRCTILDEDGRPYTRTSTTVGDDESDGVVYRVYAADAELETLYPGQVESGRGRTIKIGVLDSAQFNVQLKAGWTVRFINVPANTTWSFEEINNPAGFEIDLTGTETIDGIEYSKTRGMTGTVLSNTANDCQITNKMSAFETRILKIETGTGVKDPTTGEYTTEPTKLSGVKFIVKNNNEGADKGKYLVLSGETISWDADMANAHEFTTGNDGVVSLGNLPLGKYLLTETATQPGYNLLTEDVSFEVTADGVTYQISSMAQPTVAKKQSVIEDGKTVVYSLIEVPNSAGVELPHTGGPGTKWITMAGIALMAIGLVTGCGMRRKRERRYER